MQRNNIIVFVIVAACILAAWWVFVMPSADERQKRAEAAQKAAELRLADLKEKKRKKDEEAAADKARKEKEIKKDKTPEPAKKAEVQVVPKEEEKPETIALGGDGFHLSVDVISRGSGVRKVVLNRFEAANWRGLPTGEKMQLIQDDQYSPSYRMYHYLDPKTEDPPVLGLGEKIWRVLKPEKEVKIPRDGGGEFEKRTDGKIVEKDADGNILSEEISFATMVPDMDVEIVKTYKLEPKAYHVAMKLTIEDRRTDKNAKAIPFRYQLTGAHGLPIEGEWYTSTYRNAFMALVEPNGRVWRKLEDASRISLRRGGDRFPDGNRDENRLQYAGVANQFFGAMIVVEPEKDGDTKPRDLLAWARPTQESFEKKGVITSLDYEKDRIEFTDEAWFAVLTTTRGETDIRADDTSRFFEGQVVAGDGIAKGTTVESIERGRGIVLSAAAKQSGQTNLIFYGRSVKKAMLEADPEALEYRLLPRTRHHLEDDLDVKVGTKIVLSFYKIADPKDPEGKGKRIATWARLGDTPRPQFDDITVRVNSEILKLFPGDKVEQPFMLYHGPVKVALLAQFTGEKAVPEELVDRYIQTLHLNTLTDYPNDNFLGKISSFIKLTDVIIFVTRFMHWLLDKLHYVFGYGLSIVVLTVMVRGAMFPISRRQALFSIKMQELGPELKKIQEKYPDDAQAKMQATQAFYKQHGINPLGSCWPVFLQMPIFLGLYFAFQESIHFRLADFLWIENLAAPDMLFSWTEHIWYISTPDSLGSMFYLGPFFNILPMIAVVFMMIQQMQTMPPPTDDQQAAQQKMLKYMTIFFGIMFYKVAAGLCIYFISSSLWGLAERKLLPKKKTAGASGALPGTAGTQIAPGTPPPKWKGKNAKKEREREREKDNAPAGPIDKLKALWREILKAAEKK